MIQVVNYISGLGILQNLNVDNYLLDEIMALLYYIIPTLVCYIQV